MTYTRGRGIGEQIVEPAGANRHAFGGPPHVEFGVDVLEFDLTVERPDEEVQSHRAYQRLGERVVDQPFPVGECPLRGHHRGGRAHAGRQVPAVVVGPCHEVSYLRVADEVAGVARESGQFVVRKLETVDSICFSASSGS